MLDSSHAYRARNIWARREKTCLRGVALWLFANTTYECKRLICTLVVRKYHVRMQKANMHFGCSQVRGMGIGRGLVFSIETLLGLFDLNLKLEPIK